MNQIESLRTKKPLYLNPISILIKEDFDLNHYLELPQIEILYSKTMQKLYHFVSWGIRTRFSEGAQPLKIELDTIQENYYDLTA